jgi:phosphatidylglycerophosphate synthase
MPTVTLDGARAQKPVKTLFGWLFYRRVSLPLSLRVASTGISPWHLTALGLGSGLGAAALLATGSYWLGLAGAALASVAKIMDAMDGEVARIKHLDSSAGSIADGLCDRVRDTALVVGLGIGAGNAGASHALAWTLAAAVGYLWFFYVSAATPSHWREVRQVEDLDEKHAFRLSRGIRLGAGDTLAAAILVVAAIGQPLWLVIAIAVLSPLAIAVKVQRLFTRRSWEGDRGDAGSA